MLIVSNPGTSVARKSQQEIRLTEAVNPRAIEPPRIDLSCFNGFPIFAIFSSSLRSYMESKFFRRIVRLLREGVKGIFHGDRRGS